MRLIRLAKIISVFHRFGLDEFVLKDASNPILRGLGRVLGNREHSAPRGARLRAALEALGPIFVKFG
ncbi:MAG TPA: ubiquinone biosynthesis regulatory protein kinase UbiB, partial [Casimicrobium sp.]|nr:ubiquinone biosynthesis regulatory protein kinase UbiB [Casimicrobium sp.]